MARGRNKTAAPTKARSAVYSEQHRKHFAWVDWLSAKTGLPDSPLAEQAGLEKNYLYRKRGDGTILNPVKIQRLCEHYNVPGPDAYLLPGAVPSGEAEEFSEETFKDDRVAQEVVRIALGTRPNAQAWVLKTRALETAGYQIGDIVISDKAVLPRAGDAVIAQVFDRRTGSDAIVFRILEPPYLVAATFDPSLRAPMIVDDQRTIVVGTITQSFRGRRS